MIITYEGLKNRTNLVLISQKISVRFSRGFTLKLWQKDKKKIRKCLKQWKTFMLQISKNSWKYNFCS